MPSKYPDRPWRHLYNTARWKRTRLAQLQAEPLCRMCHEQGIVTEATIVDHITPHKGDENIFYNGPFQSLCKAHHDGAKQAQERSGYSRGCDCEGWPLDPHFGL